MKNITSIIALCLFSILQAQNSKLTTREKQLFNILENSFYLKNANNSYKTFVAKKYACLEKYYNIKPEEQKEFISTKKELENIYPIWNAHFIEGRSILEEGLQFIHFNPNTGVSETFPKCINQKDQKYL